MSVISKTRKTEPLVSECSTHDAGQAAAGFREETGGVPASFAGRGCFTFRNCRAG